jgi:mono/diheme cytochrome c family protein
VSFLVTALAGAATACGGSAASGGDAGECMPVDIPATCPSPPPSYKDTIAFLVADYCAKCHSPGGAESGKDFTTYQGLANEHVTVTYVVGLCPSSMGMPPPGYPQPTAAQRLALVTWADPCRAPNN